MKIGILITSVGAFGKTGFYNSQEIGLAKELAALYEEIIIYKAVDYLDEISVNSIDGYRNIRFIQVPARKIGTNGFIDCRTMDSSIDVLVYFSDTQLAVSTVYRWCTRNRIKMFPYIGVTKSHSNSGVIQFMINLLFKKNITVYKKCTCFVKTPSIKYELNSLGVNNCIVAPVGLDVSLINKDYKNIDADTIKYEIGFVPGDKVLLFIGRLTEEKQPKKMIEVFKEINRIKPEYKLLMVGKGELKEEVISLIDSYNLRDDVQIIDQISNSDIWKLYRIADCFVNLNRQEIFGMAILEAMYYGCKVVAWEAPGPSFIIENGKSGYIVNNDTSLIDNIINNVTDISQVAHERVLGKFTWKSAAAIMAEFIEKRGNYG